MVRAQIESTGCDASDNPGLRRAFACQTGTFADCSCGGSDPKTQERNVIDSVKNRQSEAIDQSVRALLTFGAAEVAFFQAFSSPSGAIDQFAE